MTTPPVLEENPGNLFSPFSVSSMVSENANWGGGGQLTGEQVLIITSKCSCAQLRSHFKSSSWYELVEIPQKCGKHDLPWHEWQWAERSYRSWDFLMSLNIWQGAGSPLLLLRRTCLHNKGGTEIKKTPFKSVIKVFFKELFEKTIQYNVWKLVPFCKNKYE